MNQAIITELRFFGASVFWGAVLLVIYDTLRIIRRVIKHNAFAIALEDIFYWIICSILIFLMMYRQNNGIIRGFSIMAMLLGMIAYHKFLSDYMVSGISWLINKIISLIGKGIKLLLSPFFFVFKKLKGFLKWILSKVKRLLKFMAKALKKFRKKSKIAISENEKGD